MNNELERVAADYHGALGGLHGYGVLFFVLRFIRNFRNGRREKGLLMWALFHLVTCVISFICSRDHARCSRSE